MGGSTPNGLALTVISSLGAVGLDNSMWRVPYICFCLLYAVLVFCGMWVLFRIRLRIIRADFDERLAEQIRITRAFYEDLLQTILGSKFVADDALDKSNDTGYMRLTLEKVSNWLGHAAQEAQAALNSLHTPKIKKKHN